MTAAAVTVVRRYYELLAAGDLDGLAEVLSPEVVWHGAPVPPGRAHLVGVLRAQGAAFPDLAHIVEDVIDDGRKVAVRVVTSGTHRGTFLGHPATGRRFEAPSISIYLVEDGLVREIWGVFDTIRMLQQLGLYAPENVAATDPGPQPPGPADAVALEDIRRDPLTFLHALVSAHGPIVRYVCDGRDTVLVNEPDAARAILAATEDGYSKAGTPDLQLLKPMLGEGLLTTEGTIWHRDRRRLQPLFTPARVVAAGDLMAASVDQMLARWLEAEATAPIDVVPEMSRLTLDIAARVFLSADLGDESEAFAAAMDTLNEFMGHAVPGNSGADMAFADALALIRRVVLRTILARRFHDDGTEDLLAALLDAEREHGDPSRHVLDQAVTFLLAGHETTAKALSWALGLLACHPQALARVRAEADAVAADGRLAGRDVAALPFTRAVVQETLRLYPPVWLLSRTATRDMRVGGHRITAGSLVAVSPYLLHRDERWWDAPHRFVPERFLGGSAETAVASTHFLPFGSGPRHCIGRYFALFEMPLVLASVAARADWRLLARRLPEPEALVTLRPRGGLRMAISARQRSGEEVPL